MIKVKNIYMVGEKKPKINTTVVQNKPQPQQLTSPKNPIK
jgi:hypothetical protein